MTKTDKRQAKVNPQFKCQDSSCMAKFGQMSERHRHVKEKHGHRIYCCVPDCKWIAVRNARLRARLDNVHCSKVRKSSPLRFEVQTGTPQSLAPLSHPCPPNHNIESNFTPTPPPIHYEHASILQAEPIYPDESESLASTDDAEPLHLEYPRASHQPPTFKTRLQITRQCRVYRPPRAVKRTRRAMTANILSSSSQHLASAMQQPKLCFYSTDKEEENSTSFPQQMVVDHPLDAEVVVSSFQSFRLD